MTKRFLCAIAAGAACALPVQAQQQDPAVAVVQAHLDAYRSRDFNAFLATFASDAELVYAGMVFRGKAEIRQAYQLNFQPGAPTIYLVTSGVDGNEVWMRVGYTLADGSDMCCSETAYTVRGGKIVRAEVSGP